MARFTRIRNLLVSGPTAQGRAWRPLYVLAAATGLFAIWSTLGGARHYRPPHETDEIVLASRTSDERHEPRPANVVKAVNCGQQTCGYCCGEAGCADEPDAPPATLPRERHKQSDYVIEPPDVLSIVAQSNEAEPSLLQSINGEHLVDPDGTLNLGEPFGCVQVGGLTLAAAPGRIQACLEGELSDAQVAVSVAAQNSKAYYIITEGNEGNDTVMRNPALGGETVRDALAALGDVDFLQKNVWIARPSASGEDEVLQVDAVELTSGEDLSTDYNLEPGDRIFIATRRSFWESLGDAMAVTWSTLVEMFW
jgi:protein involved in polysaccharide export with SLBB domain